MIEGLNEQRAVFRDDAHALCDDGPGVVDPVVDRARDLVFLWVTRHFEPRRDGEKRLSGKDRFQPLGQPLFGRRVETVAVEVRCLQTAIVKEDTDFFCAEVPKRGSIARDALADAICRALADALWAKAFAAFADAKRQAIRPAMVVVVASATRDISVAGQDLVIKQKLAELGLVGIELNEIRIDKRAGQVLCRRGQGKAKGHDMQTPFHAFILAVLTALATPVLAEIEEARDLMEAGRFAEAREALLPAARSGNADAEELIGVMYAMGLGVEKDPERAFEWYLRSSMKGHPGAQSGLGWYYELGIGLPAPDLVRAYLWYGLSSIGGDPDAVDSLEELTRRMSAEEIARAQVLIDDYKPWMYPFR